MYDALHDLYDEVKDIDHCKDNVITGISFLSNSDRVMIHFSMSDIPMCFDNMDQTLDYISKWVDKHDEKMRKLSPTE